MVHQKPAPDAGIIIKGASTFKCGLIIDRQENASINIGTNSYVGSYGFPPKGAKLDEFSDEPRGG
ncbi:MAG: hypothetical protein QXQ65_04700 [Conexivisphaerales archaeon]